MEAAFLAAKLLTLSCFFTTTTPALTVLADGTNCAIIPVVGGLFLECKLIVEVGRPDVQSQNITEGSSIIVLTFVDWGSHYPPPKLDMYTMSISGSGLSLDVWPVGGAIYYYDHYTDPVNYLLPITTLVYLGESIYDVLIYLLYPCVHVCTKSVI